MRKICLYMTIQTYKKELFKSVLENIRKRSPHSKLIYRYLRRCVYILEKHYKEMKFGIL